MNQSDSMGAGASCSQLDPASPTVVYQFRFITHAIRETRGAIGQLPTADGEPSLGRLGFTYSKLGDDIGRLMGIEAAGRAR